MRNRLAMLATLCALSCGAPQRPQPTTTGVVKYYQPLELRRDARRPDQAVILGTDDANGSTVLPIPVAAVTVVVDAMFVTDGETAPASGGTLAITLTAAPTPPDPTPTPSAPGASSPKPGQGTSRGPGPPGGSAPPSSPEQPTGTTPGVRGTFPAGSPSAPGAACWNAGLWSAALVATATLGKDVSDVTLSAVPAGPIECVAAPALMSAGFLAAMTGATVDPTATLAGTLNPDGTLGPVAGIPEQFLAAIAHGKTRLGYPRGMRRARSPAGQEVDLVQLAKDHHVEAIELTDVYDAYELLTHRRLPAPVPVSEADMALDPATRARLDAVYVAWRDRLAAEWAPLLQLEQAGQLPATVTAMIERAHDHGERAEALHRAGKLAAAYGRMRAAWVHAAGANQTHAVVSKLRAGDVDGAIAALTARDAGDAGVRATLDKLGALQPSTIAGHLAVIQAFQAALRGWAYHELASDEIAAATRLLGDLRTKPAAELTATATAETAAGAIATAVQQILRATAETMSAEQELALASDQGTAVGIATAGAPSELTRAAAPLEAAADAARRYVDERFVAPLARRAGISEDVARRQIAAVEPDYLVVDKLSRVTDASLPHTLKTLWGPGAIATSLLAIAGHALAQRSTALLIARYDTIGVHAGVTGATDVIDAVGSSQPFASLLATARHRARAAARAARIATGAIPVQAKLAYQLATGEETGSLDDQLAALAALWTATAFSEAAVMLARN